MRFLEFAPTAVNFQPKKIYVPKSMEAVAKIRQKSGEVKRAGYIIVIQSGVRYNLNIIDSGKPI